MKRFVNLLAASVLLMCGCTHMEVPTDVTDSLDNLKNRVAELQNI